MSTTSLTSKPVRRSRQAFSMVEVVASLGIISFALFGLIGVLPMALDRYRVAADYSVSSDIIRAVSTDLEWAFTNSSTPNLSDRYYSAEGIEVATEQDGVFVVKMQDIAEVKGELLGNSFPSLNRVTVQIYRLPLPSGNSDNVSPLVVRTLFVPQEVSPQLSTRPL